MSEPGDRRRFCFYAGRRGVRFEIADPRKDYDLVVLSSRSDIGAWSRYPSGKTKIIYELIDSYLALPRFQPKSMLRGAGKFMAGETRSLVLNYRKALEDMCRRADAVVCSTEEQQSTYCGLCANVHIILDSHAEITAKPKSAFEIGDTVNLVWEGLPHTLAAFLQIAPVLRRLEGEASLALHIITDLEFARYAGRFGRRETRALARQIMPNTYLYEWNPHLVGELVTACDLALIPLDLKDPFSRGKPENKLLFFWRLAMPTVTSASPAYSRAMNACGFDLTCKTNEDWARTLRRLIAEEPLRKRAGLRGQQFVGEHHSEEQLLERWDRLFESVLG